ncbi:hypothetical protein SAMN05421690_101048 [Nitrosomonas sp. Nm51]|nr:hypothetical protein SAMN05421690_101048 [Nitrosomonas sp. Nm51]
MCYVQFCLFFGQKDQVFVPQDMPEHIQGAKTTIILSEKQTRRARQIFDECLFKHFEQTFIKNLPRIITHNT